MSTRIEKKDETLFTYKINLSIQSNKKNENFQLNRSYIKTYISYFELSSEVEPITGPSGTLTNPQKCSVELSLTESSGPNDGMDSTEIKDAVPDYYRRPCDVWLTLINGNEKFFFYNNSSSKEWKSQKIILPLHHHHQNYTYQLWLRFNTVGLGEINVVKHLAELLAQQAHCDVKFCFEDGQHIGAHFPILTSRSPIFAAMFNHDMQETKTNQVVIKDIQLEIFKEILHYVYSGRTRIPMTEATAQSLYVAAKKYDIEDLKQECIQFLLLHIQNSNVIQLIVWADLHVVEKVKEGALHFVAENFKTIFLTDDWEKLMKNYPDLCLLATRRIVQ